MKKSFLMALIAGFILTAGFAEIATASVLDSGRGISQRCPNGDGGDQGGQGGESYSCPQGGDEGGDGGESGDGGGEG